MLKHFIKVVFLTVLFAAVPAEAQHHRGFHHHHHGYYNWVAPMVVGGVVTYVLTRPPAPVVVQPQPQPELQGPIVLQPGQRIICNNRYQVWSSSRGAYEVMENCWIQQQ